VRVYVSEPDLGKVKPGMAARIFTDSQPDRPLAGKVGYISSVAEFTPKSVQTEELRTSLVYEVRVLVEDGGNVLRLGSPPPCASPWSSAMTDAGGIVVAEGLRKTFARRAARCTPSTACRWQVRKGELTALVGPGRRRQDHACCG
jgi:hypothetical protein